MDQDCSETVHLDQEIPQRASSKSEMAKIYEAQRIAKTSHHLYLGDSRSFSFIPDHSVHLVITSPPYWSLKRYNEVAGQLGHIQEYESFLAELEKVWRECHRVLVTGGRLVIVVGDVCLARKKFGRHMVMPLHADISVQGRRIGFDNLAPIIWHKIANANYEVENGSKFFGKPYEPNAIIKNDIEYILMMRKPGGYRKPTNKQRQLSIIPKDTYDQWFSQIWSITGESTRQHPAPFPVELPLRLIRMFSFFGDTILDPFNGTGTTMVAAIETGRNSVGIELDPQYLRIAEERIRGHATTLFRQCEFEVHGR